MPYIKIVLDFDSILHVILTKSVWKFCFINFFFRRLEEDTFRLEEIKYEIKMRLTMTHES